MRELLRCVRWLPHRIVCVHSPEVCKLAGKAAVPLGAFPPVTVRERRSRAAHSSFTCRQGLGPNPDSCMSKIVMVIDDDEVFHEVVRRACRKIESVESIMTAIDGADGLRCIERCLEAGTTLPDVVFVDINMPVMDGFGFLKGFAEMRAKFPALAAVKPVAMLTSSDQQRDRDMAHELGAHKYILKGVGMDEVRKAIASCVE